MTLSQEGQGEDGKEKVCVNSPAGEHSKLVDKVKKEEKVAKEGLFDSGLKVSIASEWLDKVEDLLEDSNGEPLEKDTICYRWIGLVETLQKVETGVEDRISIGSEVKGSQKDSVR